MDVTPPWEGWRKAGDSASNGNCVEVRADQPQGIGVRDSKNPRGPVLIVSRAVWSGFTAAIKAGGFTL